MLTADRGLDVLGLGNAAKKLLDKLIFILNDSYQRTQKKADDKKITIFLNNVFHFYAVSGYGVL